MLWQRSISLALVRAALFWVDIPCQTSSSGTGEAASLAHLHGGFLFAVAMLYRERLPLLLCTIAVFFAWACNDAILGGVLLSHAHGAVSYVLTYAGLRWSSRGLVLIERGDWRFTTSDLPRFVLVGMFLFPLLLAMLNAIPNAWLELDNRASAAGRYLR